MRMTGPDREKNSAQQSARAEMLYYGNGAPQDKPTAMAMWREAAQAGDAAALWWMGNLADRGELEGQTPADAADWYRRSAEAGHGDGAFAWSLRLRDGKGVTADAEAARRWLKIAAGRGSRYAQTAWQDLRRHELGPAALKRLQKASTSFLHKALQDVWIVRPTTKRLDAPGPSSRLGGLPHAAGGQRWPACGRCANPMRFLLQVQVPLGFIAGMDPLWNFFSCQRCQDLGSQDRAVWEWRTYAAAKPAKSRRIDPPAPARPETAYEAVLVKGRRLPGYDDPSLDAWREAAAKAFEAGVLPDPYEEYRRQLAALMKSRPWGPDGSVLGGRPLWVQNDETPVCSQCQSRMTFVAEIDPGNSPNNPLNSLYLFFCAQHRKERAVIAQH